MSEDYKSMWDSSKQGLKLLWGVDIELIYSLLQLMKKSTK